MNLKKKHKKRIIFFEGSTRLNIKRKVLGLLSCYNLILDHYAMVRTHKLWIQNAPPLHSHDSEMVENDIDPTYKKCIHSASHAIIWYDLLFFFLTFISKPNHSLRSTKGQAQALHDQTCFRCLFFSTTLCEKRQCSSQKPNNGSAWLRPYRKTKGNARAHQTASREQKLILPN